jgi:hypothetical protein
VRGRVQVNWLVSSQANAGIQRTFLNTELNAFSYLSATDPKAVLGDGQWRTIADVLIGTAADGLAFKEICRVHMQVDPLVLSGSWVQFHECRHEDALNDCVATLTRSTKA